ncbi:MAG: D-isomer specific 2-hydroxyacid dehydrogenase NAD-binding protein [Candidatus Yanofskybacteria bacterium GW2011_GWA1_44_21]|uniref:D-isomer specific 2-hydroxyacid dehydrogenase NAD-binding protein n=3 Tax=Parcubacteria group TaxID=1794811 RepID=A0A0G0ZTA1_9BACT|nr:MAG: D-isomer specific 2-hydroxyacid dehydrogenase NAD-binding protein [Candidatus Wolfebacteria bacterium GW2011_GWA2_42_10]KKT50096.1 MAG: D-isomer specific 2-hydroxyacid dehydrogenase NAD-binding protein [Candidatus Yanofskybacteria bacterium GW2011_GWA1_44_21]KKT90080.1 MAG: D-isomer specific 2-hydroxyacid dehydrogenase NAD-binding protein [Candidatus Yanofskybacteria bacterium GW2011_GWB1_45_11]OGN02848.1 MAG: hypothetical protein A2657_02130 [Candidatus Yanofskybacteria bacterium RIFCSP
MKIYFFENSAEDNAIVSSLILGHELFFSDKKLNVENADSAADADIISVFVNSVVNKEILDRLPNLKHISTRSTGYDHVDVDNAKQRGISVSYVPSYGSETVAEFTFALILALNRKIFPAYHQLRESTDYNISNLGGFELKGKTLGIIGTGRIGKNVARIAKNGFQMNVIAFDAFKDEGFACEMGFEYVDLDSLLSQSDIISLHVPYTNDTHHLLNKENMGKIKKGAYLINTARGEIVETEALLQSLHDGILGGAGLDVLEGERPLKEEMEIFSDRIPDNENDVKAIVQDHVLIDMPNVIVTPHIAFFTAEAKSEILKTACENIDSFIFGKAGNNI